MLQIASMHLHLNPVLAANQFTPLEYRLSDCEANAGQLEANKGQKGLLRVELADQPLGILVVGCAAGRWGFKLPVSII
jgi:hypothetical protein